MTTPPDLRPAAVLATARRAQAEVRAAEVVVFEQAVAWAALHEVDPESSEAATWGDSPILIAGEGAPAISEFCIAEFAATLGMTANAGRSYLGDAVEIAHRLPRVHARLVAGDLPVWRARRIADQTHGLSPEAAAFVDARVAPAANSIGVKATARLVDQAIAIYMPVLAEEIARKAEDGRYITVDRDYLSYTGTLRVHGEIDMADALDLDDALARGAEQLKQEGCTLPLEVRRSLALGILARGELAPAERNLTLYLHLTENDSTTATVENAGGPNLITVDQIKTWCGSATRVSVRPVLDLDERIVVPGYRPSDRLQEQVILRDQTCAHPYCDRRSRSADLDHFETYDADGPRDQTTSGNLAPLCRYHHRLKTHGSWAYTVIRPGTYLWRSPHGYLFLRDRSGTHQLTPQQVEPPRRNAA